MARTPFGNNRPRKRPFWLTALFLVGAVLLWIGRKQGWITTKSSHNSAPASAPSPADIDTAESDSSTAAERAGRPAVAATDIDQLYRDHRDKVWVEGAGRITKLLRDDDAQPRHQRFLVETSDHYTVLIAHNLDVSARVPAKVGDDVKFRGEFVWSQQGGSIHFTHKPEHGNFNGGWVEYGGTRYE